MEYAAIIAAVVSAIGMLVSAGKEEEAQALREKTAAEYGPEILPDLDAAIAQEVGSEFASLAEDSTGRAMQLDVDAELADIYDTSGNTAADRAAYDVARRGVSQRAASAAQGNAIEAARRGQTGGVLGGVLASQSGQDELEALGGLNASIASDARSRAMQALMARSSNANTMREMDWGVKSQRASAMDLANRFNATQRQATEMYNKQLPQLQFENNLRRLSGLGAARSGVATGLDAQGAAARQTSAGLGNAALSYGQAWDEDEEGKK